MDCGGLDVRTYKAGAPKRPITQTPNGLTSCITNSELRGLYGNLTRLLQRLQELEASEMLGQVSHSAHVWNSPYIHSYHDPNKTELHSPNHNLISST